MKNTCRANDICKEAKRQTINAEDVLKALEEIDFPELIGPLRGSLNGQSIFQNWVFTFRSNFLAFLLKEGNVGTSGLVHCMVAVQYS